MSDRGPIPAFGPGTSWGRTVGLAQDEMGTACRACLDDVGACRCVVDCGALVCTGWAPPADHHCGPFCRPGNHVE